MGSMRSVRFSGLKLKKIDIKFEKQQLDIYTDLANKHPKDKFYKDATVCLAERIKKHEKQLKDASKAKPRQKSLRKKKLNRRKVYAGKC